MFPRATRTPPKRIVHFTATYNSLSNRHHSLFDTFTLMMTALLDDMDMEQLEL